MTTAKSPNRAGKLLPPRDRQQLCSDLWTTQSPSRRRSSALHTTISAHCGCRLQAACPAGEEPLFCVIPFLNCYLNATICHQGPLKRRGKFEVRTEVLNYNYVEVIKWGGGGLVGIMTTSAHRQSTS